MNFIKRFFLGLAIYGLEIEWRDNIKSVAAINDIPIGALADRDAILKILDERMDVIEQKLSARRSEFNALLPVGQRRTWRIG